MNYLTFQISPLLRCIRKWLLGVITMNFMVPINSRAINVNSRTDVNIFFETVPCLRNHEVTHNVSKLVPT